LQSGIGMAGINAAAYRSQSHRGVVCLRATIGTAAQSRASVTDLRASIRSDRHGPSRSNYPHILDQLHRVPPASNDTENFLHKKERWEDDISSHRGLGSTI
jgi:hypothetical protein